MFFRREKIHQSTFEERIANLKQFGLQSILQSSDAARVTRVHIGAFLANMGDGHVNIGIARVRS